MLQPLGGVQNVQLLWYQRQVLFMVDESSHRNNWPTQQTALDGIPFTESVHPKWLLPRLFEPRSSETKIQWPLALTTERGDSILSLVFLSFFAELRDP